MQDYGFWITFLVCAQILQYFNFARRIRKLEEKAARGLGIRVSPYFALDRHSLGGYQPENSDLGPPPSGGGGGEEPRRT